MKKIVLTSLGAILLATAANAGWYAGGYLATPSPFLKEMTLDGTIGYAFSGGIRAELDVLSANVYDDNDNTELPNINISVAPTLLKGLYDIKVDEKFKPYVGLGINPFSLTYQNLKHPDISVAKMEIEGAAIIGVSYAVNDKISLDLQYNRVFHYDLTRNASVTTSDNYGSDLIKAGIRYNF